VSQKGRLCVALKRRGLKVTEDQAHLIDLASGEVLDTIQAGRDGHLVHERHRVKMRKKFIMMFQDYLVHIAHSDVQGRHLKVLLFMLGHADYENKVCISQKYISHSLEMRQADVSWAIRKLTDYGFLRRSDNVYFVDEHIAWRGSAGTYLKAVGKGTQAPPVVSRKSAG
jgi:hypothetical protein